MTAILSDGVMERTRWHWVRHAPVREAGTTIYGAADLDADLSDTRSFIELAKRLPKDAVVVTSHLKRTEQTRMALEMAGAMLPDPIVRDDLGEQNLGDWEGRAWNDVEAEGDPLYAEFWRDPATTSAPNGESFADVTARTAQAIDEINQTYQGRDIVCVAHAGVIRAALCHAMYLLDVPDRAFAFHIANTSLTRIDFLHPGWVVSSVGVRYD